MTLEFLFQHGKAAFLLVQDRRLGDAFQYPPRPLDPSIELVNQLRLPFFHGGYPAAESCLESIKPAGRNTKTSQKVPLEGIAVIPRLNAGKKRSLNQAVLRSIGIKKTRLLLPSSGRAWYVRMD
jgi:hypothetical protein